MKREGEEGRGDLRLSGKERDVTFISRCATQSLSLSLKHTLNSEFSGLVHCCYILVAHTWLTLPSNASGRRQMAMLFRIRMPASSVSLKTFFLNSWENEHIFCFQNMKAKLLPPANVRVR